MNNHTRKYLLTWEDAFLSGTNTSGGKGWNLSCLARYGFRIPTGMVLSA
jgi:pyruvate,water dikinase